MKTILTWTIYPVFLVIALVCVGDAHAYGIAEIESSGFLRRSTERSSAASTLVIGPVAEEENEWISAKIDVQGVIAVEDPTTFTVRSKELYVATSRDMLTHHQFTLGDRKFSWSVLDDRWTYGLWNPRFLWDPLSPEQVGLPGAYYSFNNSLIRVVAMASPIAVPELGYPIGTSKGKIVTSSPWFRRLPEKAVIGNRVTELHYEIEVPPTQEVIFRPNAAAQVRLGREHGPWISAQGGYLPVNSADMAVEIFLSTTDLKLNTQIHPRFMRHALGTLEMGFADENWGVWASGSYEKPDVPETSPDWLASSMGPAYLGAAGFDLSWNQGVHFGGSFLLVREFPVERPAPSALSGVSLDLGSRFPYKRAVRIDAGWEFPYRFQFDNSWIYDIETRSQLLSGGVLYRSSIWESENRPGIVLGLGADLILTRSYKGTIGQYGGNDRVRGSISYVF